MATLTIKLPSQRAQTEFNLRRWDELAKDPDLAKIEGRVEMDRFGHVIISPPPAANHGNLQVRIAILLDRHMGVGDVLTKCPISIADGVGAADVAWASPESMNALGNRACFSRSPEICVEILSRGNTDAEIQEKMALYFDAGAEEVWLCDNSGAMKFFAATKPVGASKLCPEFPAKIQLR